jgi:hypothetical protein
MCRGYIGACPPCFRYMHPLDLHMLANPTSVALDIKLTVAHSWIGIHNSSCTYPNLWRCWYAIALGMSNVSSLSIFFHIVYWTQRWV